MGFGICAMRWSFLRKATSDERRDEVSQLVPERAKPGPPLGPPPGPPFGPPTPARCRSARMWAGEVAEAVVLACDETAGDGLGELRLRCCHDPRLHAFNRLPGRRRRGLSDRLAGLQLTAERDPADAQVLRGDHANTAGAAKAVGAAKADGAEPTAEKRERCRSAGCAASEHPPGTWLRARRQPPLRSGRSARLSSQR